MTAPAATMSDVLLGLGLPGVVILALLAVVKVLYGRATEEAAYHRQRADRLEEEVRVLNKTMHIEVAPLVVRATEALGDAVVALDSIRRGAS